MPNSDETRSSRKLLSHVTETNSHKPQKTIPAIKYVDRDWLKIWPGDWKIILIKWYGFQRNNRKSSVKETLKYVEVELLI